MADHHNTNTIVLTHVVMNLGFGALSQGRFSFNHLCIHIQMFTIKSNQTHYDTLPSLQKADSKPDTFATLCVSNTTY